MENIELIHRLNRIQGQIELERVYPFIWMDAQFFKIREDGKVNCKAVHDHN